MELSLFHLHLSDNLTNDIKKREKKEKKEQAILF